MTIERDKRLWRALFMVHSKSELFIGIRITEYEPEKEITFNKYEFAKEDWDFLEVGKRYFAMINTDAKSDSDLVIKQIERAPEVL